MHRAAGPILGAAVAALLALTYRLEQPPQSRQAVTSPPGSVTRIPAIAPVPRVRTFRSADGDALWRQSLVASGPGGTPIKAQVTITRSVGSALERTRFDLVDGGGEYRLSYTAPQSARGRIVVCDGKTLWQYEPVRRTVLRRPLSPRAPASPFEESVPPDDVHTEIEGTVTSVNGRRARVLAFRDAKGSLYSRRWLDTATGRTLRSETYDAQTGKRLVQVELRGFQILSHPAPSLFRPDFPTTARVLKADAVRAPDIKRAADSAGLPTIAGTYQLRGTLLSQYPPEYLTDSAGHTDHLMYSNGIDTISVFVAAKTAESSVLRPADSWQAVAVSPGIPAFAHTDRQGRAAIAWVRNGKRFVAVARLPQSELLSMIRSLTAGR